MGISVSVLHQALHVLRGLVFKKLPVWLGKEPGYSPGGCTTEVHGTVTWGASGPGEGAGREEKPRRQGWRRWAPRHVVKGHCASADRGPLREGERRDQGEGGGQNCAGGGGPRRSPWAGVGRGKSVAPRSVLPGSGPRSADLGRDTWPPWHLVASSAACGASGTHWGRCCEGNTR